MSPRGSPYSRTTIDAPLNSSKLPPQTDESSLCAWSASAGGFSVTVPPLHGNPLKRPQVLGRGEASRTYRARGSLMLFKALAEQDDADLSLMERTLPPGGRRPPPHRHTNCSEAYFVLDGQVTVVIEGEDLASGAEQSCWSPAARLTPLAMPARSRPDFLSSTSRLWTRISPGSTSYGTATSRLPPTRSGP